MIWHDEYLDPDDPAEQRLPGSCFSDGLIGNPNYVNLAQTPMLDAYHGAAQSQSGWSLATCTCSDCRANTRLCTHPPGEMCAYCTMVARHINKATNTAKFDRMAALWYSAKPLFGPYWWVPHVLLAIFLAAGLWPR